MDGVGWSGGPREHDGASIAADPVGATQRTLLARRRQRRWIAALWAVALVVVALAAVTVAVSIDRAVSSSSSAPSPGGGNAPATSMASTTTSLPSGNGPVITSLSPSQGAVGTVVTIAGSGLVSSDGQVLAHFGGVGAPTSCDSATSCRATVPSPGGASPRVAVTVSTAAGTSNPLPFTYQ